MASGGLLFHQAAGISDSSVLPLPRSFYKSLKLSRKLFFHAKFFFPSEVGKFSKSCQGKKRNIQRYFSCVSLDEWETEESWGALWWLRYSIGRQKKDTPSSPIGSDTALPFHWLTNRHWKHQAYGIYWSLSLPPPFSANGQILIGVQMWVWSATLPRKFPIHWFIKSVSLTLLLLESRVNAEWETMINSRLVNNKSGNGAGGRG